MPTKRFIMQIVHVPAISLKEKHRREREELIIRAAEEVLQEKGYYEASMDEIAARVGIAKGTIYTHFPGKEELVFAFFSLFSPKVYDRLLLGDDLSHEDLVKHLQRIYFNGIANCEAS